MTDIQTFAQLDDFVKSFLKEDIAEVFQKARKNCLEVLSDQIDRETARVKRYSYSPRKEEIPQIVSDFLERFEGTLTELEEGYKNKKYPRLICDSILNIDKKIVLPQEEERFLPETGNKGIIRTAKRIKRILRSIQRIGYRAFSWPRTLFKASEKNHSTPWTQEVLLRPILCYFLAKEFSTYSGWLHQDLSHCFFLLTDFEKMVKSHLQSQEIDRLNKNSHQNGEFLENWTNLLEKYKIQIRQQIKRLDEEIPNFIEQKTSELLPVLHIAGTVECPKDSFFKRQTPDLLRDLDNRMERLIEKHAEVDRNKIEELSALITFLQFGEKLHIRRKKAALALRSLQKNSALDETEQLLARLKELETTLSPGDHFAEESEKFSHLFNTSLLQSLNKEIDQQRISSLCEDLSADILKYIAELPARLVDIEIEYTEKGLDFTRNSYELNRLTARFFKEEVINELLKKGSEITDLQQQLRLDAVQTLDIIETNLMMAARAESEETSQKEEPVMIAKEGLSRAAEKLRDIVIKNEKAYKELLNLVEQNITDTYGQLLKHIKNKNFEELHWKNKGYLVRSQALDWKAKIQVGVASIQDYIAVRYRFVSKKLSAWYKMVVPWLGYPKTESVSTDSSDISAYLSETKNRIQRLPFIYRHLFDTASLPDDRFYISEPAINTSFKKAYESWKKGVPSNFALIGERGSGKSSFLMQLPDLAVSEKSRITITINNTIYRTQELIKLLAKELDTGDCSEPDELIDYVTRKENKPSVVVLENIQNLYIRNMHGYEAVRAFLLIMAKTSEHIFWVVTGSRYAWAFMDKVLDLSDYFSHLNVCDSLDDDTISELIMKRHRASGYDLVFQPDEEIKKSRLYKKSLKQEESVQEYLQHIYFQKLAKIAEGNASIAMAFWLRSIKEFDDQRITIAPVEVTSFGEIADITNEILFALAAIVLHDSLNTLQFAKILNKDEQSTRLLLSHMVSKGIMVTDGSEYTLNFLLYRQVIRYLKQRNIIHLTDI